MANTVPIPAFLAGKSFVIPTFQRDYAWEMAEIEDLFQDVGLAQRC
jgi:uncharacterized protein with ParB-like and HNH nuclease domain